MRGNSFYFITFNFEGNVFFLVENFVDELFSNPEFWAKKNNHHMEGNSFCLQSFQWMFKSNCSSPPCNARLHIYSKPPGILEH